jgi:hypothetical protein
MPLTHAMLIERAAKWLANTRKCSIVLTQASSYSNEHPDAIGWFRGGWSIVVECKTSVSDFYADRRKRWRQPGAIAMGQERWYLAEPGLIKPALVEDTGWGLLECHNTIRRVVDAERYPGRTARGTFLIPWAPERMGPEIDALLGALYNHAIESGKGLIGDGEIPGRPGPDLPQEKGT